MNQLGTQGGSSTESRERINLSVSAELKDAIEGAAAALGLTASQLVVQAVVAALPAIEQQSAAAGRLVASRKQQIHKAQAGKPSQTRK